MDIFYFFLKNTNNFVDLDFIKYFLYNNLSKTFQIL